MGIVRAHVVISGRVQGVYFRSYVKERAVSMGIHGWVRNLFDGTVEAIFEGETESVHRMIAWCQRGPSAARVDHVETNWLTPLQDSTTFELRRTAAAE
ncbi:MAG TPA: acylphosphatase [Anaerolineae bacterium]|nr:acylphosphatase [Anaerolineae bacterium]